MSLLFIMCAINGFNFSDRRRIQAMNGVTRHRGPDGTGIFLDNGISLGHNRLSIIDLSDAASQPMKSADGNLMITFSGEIYNFKELKKELEDFYPFRTQSDTEVILAAYKKWGKDCVKKFNGIFALAIWDRINREIFLARDPMGVKPLYYYLSGAKFIFSSEIKAILEHDIPRRLNREAFHCYMRVLYAPEPMTMFEGIYKFPQASCGFYKGGNLSVERYWAADLGNYLDIQKAQIEDELRGTIHTAVKMQRISDRPLGLYLSGGLDSSIILYHMSQNRGKIDTFSVGFELEEKEQREKFNADFDLARRTAGFFASNHHEVLIKPADVPDLFERLVWHTDEPISNLTALAMFKLSEFSKKRVDVILTGDGGDELFGGYDRYRLSLAASYIQKIPGFLRAPLNVSKKFMKLNTPAGIDRFKLFMFQKEEILARSIAPQFLDPEGAASFFEREYFGQFSKTAAFEEILMDVDRRTWLVDFALMLTDKMSMANGVEARVPLLDKNLVMFASRLPLKYKTSLFKTKIIPKNAYRGKIPEFLLNQPKRGWFSPGAKWLRTSEVRDWARDILSRGYYSGTADVFNWSELEHIFSGHRSGKEYNLNILWAILTFQIWAKRFNIRV